VPVAVLTAAAHRAGKRIGDALVDDGWDLALWSLAVLRSRVEHAQARGQRAVALRGNVADARSVALLLADTARELGTVDVVVHLAAEELTIDPTTGADPATLALVEHGAVRVVYIGAPTWDPSSALAWCAAREVDALALDATRKVHDLTPTVASFLAS
jgi:NAD(P)-dependent dehydrogenase (short-subunit alcohol dehydrogenase family)